MQSEHFGYTSTTSYVVIANEEGEMSTAVSLIKHLAPLYTATVKYSK